MPRGAFGLARTRTGAIVLLVTLSIDCCDGGSGKEPCSGFRRSKDAIVWLGQAKHSSYDRSHKNTLNASMSSVGAAYGLFVGEADVLVWHEGDLSSADADALSRKTNVRWCALEASSGWGAPPSQQSLSLVRSSRWSPGYLYMIRWYAVTCWRVLRGMGYEWAMRFDDDSFLLSDVHYNIFDRTRSVGADYGFRTIARECDKQFGEFVDDYLRNNNDHPFIVDQLKDDATIFCERFPKHCDKTGRRTTHPKARLRPKRYCDGPGRLGFYNNWFVTRIDFWLSDAVSAFRAAFDDSGLIFSHRNNDLIFQTAAVRLFMDRKKWIRFADWTYQHHTVRDNAVAWGGIETGYADSNADAALNNYLARWHPPESITDTTRVSTCRVQLSVNDTRFRSIRYIPHGQTRWNVPAAPYCNKNGYLPIW